MFSTDCSVRAVHPSHVLLKQLLSMATGLQSSKTPAGKVVNAELYCQAYGKYCPLFMLQAPHVTMLALLEKAHPNTVALDKSRAGKLTMRVLYHVASQLVALVKFTSDGNEVRAVQLYHA